MKKGESMELEKILINKCIAHFNAVVLNEEENDFYGKLPGYLIIEYQDAVRRTEHHYKLTLKKRWKYCQNDITVESLVALDESNPISGMYYERASASFYWDLGKNKAFINVTFGPRYARGFSYDIIQQVDGYMLDKERLEWVS